MLTTKKRTIANRDSVSRVNRTTHVSKKTYATANMKHANRKHHAFAIVHGDEGYIFQPPNSPMWIFDSRECAERHMKGSYFKKEFYIVPISVCATDLADNLNV